METDSKKLKWGILGAGGIARRFADAVQHSERGRVVAIGSRTNEKAQQFAETHGAIRAHSSYESLLADDQVEAVYIATPHPLHAPWCLRATEAGKHILCEKPLAVNYTDAARIVEAAQRHDVFLMEGFMYRCHPQTKNLVDLIRNGRIGKLLLIQASHGFKSTFDPNHRLYANDLAGGAILDVGCYTTSMSRLIVGAASGESPEEPINIQGAGHLGQTGVDEWAVGTLFFADDVFAQISTTIQSDLENAVRITGTEGQIEVTSPWLCSGFEGGSATITVHRHGEQPQQIVTETNQWLYGIEADMVAKHLEDRQASWPAMTWNDTLANMRVLDQWRQAIGLKYNFEKE